MNSDYRPNDCWYVDVLLSENFVSYEVGSLFNSVIPQLFWVYMTSFVAQNSLIIPMMVVVLSYLLIEKLYNEKLLGIQLHV